MGGISRSPYDRDSGKRVRGEELEPGLAELERKAETIPSVVVVAAGVVSFGVSVAEFAFGQARLGVATASVGLLVIGAGLSWLAMERRRIRQAERDWPRPSPDDPARRVQR